MSDGPAAIFCLNLASERERRGRMERRLDHHGLLERTRFVEAIAIPGAPDRRSEEWRARASVACFMSHLEAMRLMLADPELAQRGAVVCEDDCLLHDEFAERYDAAIENLSRGATMCSLGYLLSGWHRDFAWAGRRPQRENLCPIVPDTVWGSHMYWISPDYARRLLELYGDADPGELSPIVEHKIEHPSGGYVSYPTLALQDTIDSLIRPPEDLDFHLSGQAMWRYRDYAACERGDERSPLAAQPPPPRRTIGLCMIVRDEAAVIERCLESALPLIDTWTICDTGSRDGTPELVEATLGDLHGTLHHRPWRDFGANRSELMELAAGSADYLLLLDADQTLERRGPLPPLEADSYLLRYAGSLDYAVPRLVRGDRRWWYEGATHEYLATEGEHSEQTLEGLAVHHHADSGTRGEKLERDRRLLERELEARPDDQRSTFYLAQTLSDSGADAAAVELYRRRVELGGWDQEVFYAAYQAGVVAGRSDPAAAVPLLEEAARLRPSRAEPLHELSRLSRQRGRHREAYEYAKRGLEVPYPDDVLFVHRDVYEWGLLFELSVSAFLVDEVDEALAANERLLDEGRLPPAFAATVHENIERCLERLPAGHPARRVRAAPLDGLLPSGVELAEVRLDLDPPWPQFNPTIAADEDGEGFRLIVRSANYRIERGAYRFLDEGRTVRTLNYLVTLDRSLELADVAPLEDTHEGPARHSAQVVGYEDCRLVRAGGHWLALATVRDRNPGELAQVALLELDGSRIAAVRILSGPDPQRHEKNWMPFTLDGSLHLVYSCSPALVFRCDPATGELSEAASHPGPVDARDFRGGSQGIEVADGHLFVVHEAVAGRGGRRYHHRFVLLDHELRLAAASPRFSFTGNAIELCAGLARRGDELVLAFGVEDRAAALGVCSEQEALALLEPLRAGRAGQAALTGDRTTG